MNQPSSPVAAALAARYTPQSAPVESTIAGPSSVPVLPDAAAAVIDNPPAQPEEEISTK